MQMTRWPLWRERTRTILLALSLDALALLPVLFDLTGITVSQVLELVVLGALSCLYSIFTRRSERLVNALRLGETTNLLGGFTFAGAVTLPPSLTVILVAVVYAADWRTRQSHGGALFKHVTTAAVVALGCVAAGGVASAVPGPDMLGGTAGIVVFTLVNVGLIALVIAVSGHRKILRMFLSSRSHAVDVATQALGLAIAAGMKWHVALAVLLPPALVAVQRMSVPGRVLEAKPIQPGSKLWTEAAWSVLLAEAVAAGDRFAVFVINADPSSPVDADDMHNALAESLAGLDPRHRAGRLTDGPLVLLVPGMAAAGARIIALRLTEALGEAGISAAVGSAASWPGGPDQNDVMVSALSNLVTWRASRSRASQV